MSETSPSTSPSGGAGGPVSSGPVSSIDVWQQVLAAEHAAIWGYGLVGATEPLAAPAERALAAHRDRRLRCQTEVRAAGGDPVVAAVAYDIAQPANAGAARALAAELEASCQVAYSHLTASPSTGDRVIGARWLRESAVTSWAWAGDLEPLPGLEQP